MNRHYRHIKTSILGSHINPYIFSHKQYLVFRICVVSNGYVMTKQFLDINKGASQCNV